MTKIESHYRRFISKRRWRGCFVFTSKIFSE